MSRSGRNRIVGRGEVAPRDVRRLRPAILAVSPTEESDPDVLKKAIDVWVTTSSGRRRRRERPNHLFEMASKVGHVARHGRHVGGPLGTPVTRPELGRDHQRQGGGIGERYPDSLVSRIGRWGSVHRTDVPDTLKARRGRVRVTTAAALPCFVGGPA